MPGDEVVVDVPFLLARDVAAEVVGAESVEDEPAKRRSALLSRAVPTTLRREARGEEGETYV